MFQNNIIYYFFRNSYENEIKNEVNSDQIESSFNEVEHDKNLIYQKIVKQVCYKVFYLVII